MPIVTPWPVNPAVHAPVTRASRPGVCGLLRCHCPGHPLVGWFREKYGSFGVNGTPNRSFDAGGQADDHLGGLFRAAVLDD